MSTTERQDKVTKQWSANWAGIVHKAQRHNATLLDEKKPSHSIAWCHVSSESTRLPRRQCDQGLADFSRTGPVATFMSMKNLTGWPLLAVAGQCGD